MYNIFMFSQWLVKEQKDQHLIILQEKQKKKKLGRERFFNLNFRLKIIFQVIVILFIISSWAIFLYPVQIQVLFWEGLEGNVEESQFYFDRAMHTMKEKAKKIEENKY